MKIRRPAVEYVRDVYAELMGMGEGVRRPGDRSDISSDEEDEMEVRWQSFPKRKFLETPVTSLHLSSFSQGSSCSWARRQNGLVK